MKTDTAGNVYCTAPGGVAVLDAQGVLLGKIAIPEQPSAVALLREVEVEPVDAGPLKNSRYVEPAMMLLIQLAYAQKMGQVGFKLLQR